MPNDQAPKVSFIALRAILTDGFWTLLNHLPVDSEPLIDLAVQGDGETIPIEVNDPHVQIEVLADFVAAVRLLAMGRTPRDVRRLMADGVAQRIVSGDDSWAQELID